MVTAGGNSGVEEVRFLTQFADKIRLSELMPQLKASLLLQEKITRHRQDQSGRRAALGGPPGIEPVQRDRPADSRMSPRFRVPEWGTVVPGRTRVLP